jgi:hypothetical protein
MKYGRTFHRCLLAAAFILILSFSAFAVPQLINYQGELSDSSGNPVSGDVSVTFTIYNAASAGDVLWNETQTVTVINGVFNVLLGSQTPFPTDLFSLDDTYLGVKVGADAEMTPRQQLASVPYALVAQKCSEVLCVPGDQTACYTGDPATRNVGECTTGTRICGQDGSVGSCVGEVTPVTESCNGLDDDCNSATDDNLAPPDCANQTGVCAGAVKTCGGVSGWLACDASNYGQDYEATEVTCDGKDNDCDGNTDNGLTAPACDLQLGVCAGSVRSTCGGASGWQACGAQEYGQDYEADEVTCDALDNDCDGTVDEGCPTYRHYIFATSAVYNGNIGGLSAADALCQAAGDSGSFTSGLGATWTAVMSDETTNAIDRIGTIQWPVYNTWGDMVSDESSGMYFWGYPVIHMSAVRYDEKTETVNPSGVHTGTNTDGTADTGQTCNSWTSADFVTSHSGLANSMSSKWIGDGTANTYCSDELHIYCISGPIQE